MDPPAPATTTGGRRLRALHALLRAAAPRLWFLEDELVGLGALVAPGATCVDVGAAHGLYTWSFAALAGPSGSVHAVEALPGRGRVLDAGARLLGAASVTVHHAALGERAGAAVMSVPVRSAVTVPGRAFLTDGARGLGANEEFGRHRELPVQVTTIDDLVAGWGLERVDVIKADVEGAELAVLRGAREVLRRDRPVLLLEVEERHLVKYGASPDALVTHLAGLGYRLHAWDGAAWRAAPEVSTGQRNYAFSVRPLDPAGG